MMRELGLGHFNHINQMIILTVIKVIGFHCTLLINKYLNGITTVKLGYNKLGYSELPFIANKFFSPKSMYFT